MTDNTQEHRNYALNKRAEEDREMAKSEPKFGEWCDISSAPKDGRAIQVATTQWVQHASWRQDAYDSLGNHGWQRVDGFFLQPTHWAPLPDPPKEKP